MDLLIKNGKIVSHEQTFIGDIAVDGGKIAAIGKLGSLGKAKQVIDAGGLLVMPGMIDPHVHIRHPFKGGFSSDDFYTATVSAAFGGVTTLMDFAIQWDKKLSLCETMVRRKEQFNGETVVDYALHSCATVSNMATLDNMAPLIKNGSPSFKMYMTYSKQGRMSDDGLLSRGLMAAGQCGGMVGVHAENDAMCCFNEAEFSEKGLTKPHYFPIAKGNMIEAEAINRALYLNGAVGGRLYIFHLSTKEGLELLREARNKGQEVFAETCIHYLTMDSSYYDRKDGVNFICSPPLRSFADQKSLWDGINSGLISVVSSDHCGFSLADKALGDNNFMATPNGLPGIETRLPALYTYGVESGRITVNKLVEVMSYNPAKIFGLYPQKGILAPGSDADIILVDPLTRHTVDSDMLHSPVGWTPFAGVSMRGFAVTTILRGQVIVDNGCFYGEKGQGCFVAGKLC